MKQENPRLDIVTRSPFPKEELLRFVLKDGVIEIGQGAGRGYYLHKKTDLDAAKTYKALGRILRREVTEEDIRLLKEGL